MNTTVAIFGGLTIWRTLCYTFYRDLLTLSLQESYSRRHHQYSCFTNDKTWIKGLSGILHLNSDRGTAHAYSPTFHNLQPTYHLLYLPPLLALGWPNSLSEPHLPASPFLQLPLQPSHQWGHPDGIPPGEPHRAILGVSYWSRIINVSCRYPISSHAGWGQERLPHSTKTL
jgi:hypothetical protein